LSKFQFRELLDGAAPKIKIVDVGALPIEGMTNSWNSLVDQGLCEVMGFEPDEEGCAKLNAEAKPSQRYLPYAIADGKPATFRQCNFPMTSSLLEPNAALLNMFSGLGELIQVLSRDPIDTHRLDDIDAAAGTDLLKLDVQGAELMVIENATKVLADTLVVETEAEFVQLYENQPLFAEVDQALRRQGFVFHLFLGFAGRTFKPMLVANDPARALSQVLWSEAVYVRDFMALDGLSAEQLLKMAIILHEAYNSCDLVHLCLKTRDAKTGDNLAARYLAQITQSDD